MNKNRKKLTVRFYLVESDISLFSDISAAYQVGLRSGQNTRIINYKEKKYFIKLDKINHTGKEFVSISVVRERNTWQTKALSDGTISGIQLNQGIIGDPYYYFLDPEKKTIFGLTTGLNESLRNVGIIALIQFQKNRLNQISLDPIMRTNESTRINELSNLKNLELKVDFNELGEVDTSTPNILRELSVVARSAEIYIKFPTIEDGNGLSKTELIEIVDFLNGNDACRKLTVEGEDVNGSQVKLDFNRSLYVYKEEIDIKTNFIDENNAHKVLMNASETINI